MHLSRVLIPVILAFAFLIGGCGPVTTTKTIFEWQTPPDQNPVQDVGSIRVEFQAGGDISPTARTKIPVINSKGQYLASSETEIQLMDATVFPPGTVPYPVTVTNLTDHIVRFSTAVIRLFDPAGEDFQPLSSLECLSEWTDRFPDWPALGPTSWKTFETKVKTMKMISPATELLPNIPYKGYLVFKPTSVQVPGIWKVTLYDIPVETDDAGKITKTVKVEYRSELQKFNCTYIAKDMLSSPELKNKVRIE